MGVTKKNKPLEKKRVRADGIPVVVIKDGQKCFIKPTIKHDKRR